VTSVIEVVLQIPEEIAAGLAAGTLVRTGGVVRERASGQLRAFLGETGAGSESLDELLMSDSVGDVFDRATNADVRHTPFAKIERQIQSIADRLREFEKNLKGMRDKLDLMQWHQQAMLDGTIAAALEMAERGERSGDNPMIERAWAKLWEAREQLAAMLETLVGSVEPLSQALQAHEAFALLLCRYHLTALAAARCDWLLHGAGAAYQAAERSAKRIIKFREGFLSALRNFGQYQRVLVAFDPAARERLRGSVKDLLMIERKATGQALELEFCAQAALTPVAWRELIERPSNVLLLRDAGPASGDPS
jgi:hypothetical protein